MPWFGIRSIYLFGKKSDGTNVFEERIVCFEADSPDRALAKAELESEQYAAERKFDFLPERIAYEQDGEPLIDGYEVWSELSESRQSLPEFYADRYGKYEYHPE
jgi:hypothetical protein